MTACYLLRSHRFLTMESAGIAFAVLFEGTHTALLVFDTTPVITVSFVC